MCFPGGRLEHLSRLLPVLSVGFGRRQREVFLYFLCCSLCVLPVCLLFMDLLLLSTACFYFFLSRSLAQSLYLPSTSVSRVVSSRFESFIMFFTCSFHLSSPLPIPSIFPYRSHLRLDHLSCFLCLGQSFWDRGETVGSFLYYYCYLSSECGCLQLCGLSVCLLHFHLFCIHIKCW